jgi:hypothetical protein
MTDDEINEQELDRFEGRFFGTMQGPDAAAFDAELSRDAALKERYELFVLSVRGIRSNTSTLSQGLRQVDVGSFDHARDPEVGDVDSIVPQGPEAETLRERMRSIDQELDARNPVVRPILRPWMWAAAAAVLAGLSGVLWFMDRDTPEGLADEFAITEPGLPVLMGTSPRSMAAIMNAYKQNDFATARGLLMKAVETDPQNDTLYYFNGVLEEREGGCASAEVWFTHVPASSVFAGKARYNLALCALRSGELSRAREQLDAIAGMQDAQVSAKARELLLRLKSL